MHLLASSTRAFQRSIRGRSVVPRLAAFAAASVVAVAIVGSPSPASAASGDLDATFGKGGKVSYGHGRIDLEHTAADVLVQSDGRVVVVGRSTTGGGAVGMARFTTDGRLDKTFGRKGQVVFMPGTTTLVMRAMLVGDAIVVVGGTTRGPAFSDFDSFLARFTPDGSPDTSFGPTGVRYVDMGGSDIATDVAPGANGTILLAGKTQDAVYAARRVVSGKADLSFGVGGRRTIPVASTDMEAIVPSVARASSKTVIAFTDVAAPDLVSTRVVRLTSAGSFDSTFSGDGSAILDTVGGAEVVRGVLVSGSRVVTVADSSGTAVLTAIASNGSPDLTWGDNGVRTVGIGDAGSSVSDAVVDVSGRVTVAGTAVHAGGSNWWAARLDSLGSSDATFTGVDRSLDGAVGAAGIASAGNGYVLGGSMNGKLAAFEFDGSAAPRTSFSGDGIAAAQLYVDSNTRFDDMTVSSDGTLFALSSTPTSDSTSVATVWKMRPDGALAKGFGRGGKVDIRITDRAVEGLEISAAPDGRILVALISTTTNGSRSVLVVASVRPDGSPDLTFGPKGRRTIEPTVLEPAGPVQLLVDSRGRTLVAASTAAGVLHVNRLLRNGGPDRSFGDEGRVLLDAVGKASFAASVIERADGGYTLLDLGTMRILQLRSDGKPKLSFGTAGAVSLNLPKYFKGSVVDMARNGALALAANDPTGALLVAKIRPDGTRDTAFGQSGVVSIAPGNRPPLFVSNTALDSKGRVLVTGARLDFSALLDVSSIVVRFDTAGAVDKKFSRDGEVSLDLMPGAGEVGLGLVAQGSKVLVGAAPMAPGGRIAIARLLN